jgi:hypothetical protein
MSAQAGIIPLHGAGVEVGGWAEDNWCSVALMATF